MSGGKPDLQLYELHQDDAFHEEKYQECVVDAMKLHAPQLLGTAYEKKIREDYDYLFRTSLKTYSFETLFSAFSVKDEKRTESADYELAPMSRYFSKPIAGGDSSMEGFMWRVKRDHPSIPKQQPPPPPPPEELTRLLSKKRPRQDIPEPLPPTYASAGGGDSSLPLENEKWRPIQNHPTIPNPAGLVSKKRPRQDIPEQPLGWLSFEDITRLFSKQSPPPEPMAPHPPTHLDSSIEDEKPRPYKITKLI